MNFSSYSNLNDQTTREPSEKRNPINESNSKKEFKIYKISHLKKPLCNSSSGNGESFPMTCKFESQSHTTSDNCDIITTNSESIYGFANDSQFMNYQSSYNNLFGYQEKARFPRSDSLLSLSSQVDLATIENKVFSPLENQYTITRYAFFCFRLEWIKVHNQSWGFEFVQNELIIRFFFELPCLIFFRYPLSLVKNDLNLYLKDK
jgi:hypothetical protein